MNVTREHVTAFDCKAYFHVRRGDFGSGFQTTVFLIGDDTSLRFGTIFGATHQLETEVQTGGSKEVILVKCVAEHDRKFKQHDVDLSLVRVKIVHVLFVIVLAIVERQFRYKAKVFREHRNLDDKACACIPASAPTIGFRTEERVKSALQTCSKEHGLREPFTALLADFGARRCLCLVSGVSACVFFVICEFAVVGSVVRAGFVGFGGWPR